MRWEGLPTVPAKNADIRGLRIGLPSNYYFDALDLEVAESVRRAVQTAAALGARIVDIKVPDIGALNVVGRVLLLAEATSVHQEHLNRRGDIGVDVLSLLDQGRLIRGPIMWMRRGCGGFIAGNFRSCGARSIAFLRRRRRRRLRRSGR